MEKTPKNSEKKKMINEQDRREQRFIKTDYHASNKKTGKSEQDGLTISVSTTQGFRVKKYKIRKMKKTQNQITSKLPHEHKYLYATNYDEHNIGLVLNQTPSIS